MKRNILLKTFTFILSISLFSCTCNLKQKAKNTANKTGEVIAETGSEFVDGVSKGVEKAFQNEVKFSDELSKQGLKAGKIMVSSSDSANENILTAYLIFDGDIDRRITVKLFDENSLEYGRVSQQIKGSKGEAKYVDFVFDNRTNIDGRGKITIE
jgi:hypothetical protein